MTAFLRSNEWVLNLAILALGSYFLANTLSAVLAHKIRVVPTVDDVFVSSVVPEPFAPGRGSGLTAIVERNLMGLKRESLSGPDPSAPPAGPAPVSGRDFKEGELQPCTFNGVLRATLVADNPNWSLAVVVNNATREPAVFSINEGSNKLGEDAVLVAVRSRQIVVRRRDHFERCQGEGEVASATPTLELVVPDPPSAEDSDGPSPSDMSGVVKLSESDYRVERAEVDRVLANLNEVAMQARIVPSFKNGKANGFKMFSIKQGSIYWKIGLQNGDVIQKINGYEMNSVDRGLEIYSKLRDATNLTIELQRRGDAKTLNYAIR